VLLSGGAGLVEIMNTLDICFSIILVGKELLAGCVDEEEDEIQCRYIHAGGICLQCQS